MIHSYRGVAILGLAVTSLLATSATSRAQTAPVTETLSLFDGKSLDGWKPTDFYGAGEVAVEDGSILIKLGTKMTGFTSTRTDLPTTNYELSFEAKRVDGSDFFAAATFPVGKSFITLVNGGWGGGVTGLSSLDGSDAHENDTGRSYKYVNGKWYRFRVRVTDKTIHAWIDDKLVVRVNHEGRHVGTRIESRRNQPLGFAAYESIGAVKAISIRPLTAAEVEEANQPIE